MSQQTQDQQKEAPKHVILVMVYHPKAKASVQYDALVVGSRELPDHDEPVLNLVYFRHDDTASHHALNGIDWSETLDRVLDVPHQDDAENQSFYWIDADDQAWKLQSHLERARARITELESELAETTEGKDKALQLLADAAAAKKPMSGTGDVIPISSVGTASLPASGAVSGVSSDGPVNSTVISSQTPAQPEVPQAAQNESSAPAPSNS